MRLQRPSITDKDAYSMTAWGRTKAVPDQKEQ
jgi:hypothetical protein